MGALEAALQRAWLSRGALACALWPLSLLARGWLALRPMRAPQPLPVPVLVVGNLVAGGAGKTPTVIAVVALLSRHGFTPGVVSRGHRRDGAAVQGVAPDTPAAQCGDEPLLLRIRCGVPVVVGRDRVAAARELLRLYPAVDIIVSDDGLQHRRLPRRAAVIVFDERGAGNGWLLPAGPLREPMTARPPPRSVVLYNAAQPTTAWPGHLAQRRLAGAVALRDWWAGAAATPPALAALAERPLLAVAGVARPQRFFTMLRAAGLAITECALPDHFDYAELPWPGGTADVVLTEKDAVKLDPARVGSTRVWVTPLDFATSAAFDAELLALLAPPAAFAR